MNTFCVDFHPLLSQRVLVLVEGPRVNPPTPPPPPSLPNIGAPEMNGCFRPIYLFGRRGYFNAVTLALAEA